MNWFWKWKYSNAVAIAPINCRLALSVLFVRAVGSRVCKWGYLMQLHCTRSYRSLAGLLRVQEAQPDGKTRSVYLGFCIFKMKYLILYFLVSLFSYFPFLFLNLNIFILKNNKFNYSICENDYYNISKT